LTGAKVVLPGAKVVFVTGAKVVFDRCKGGPLGAKVVFVTGAKVVFVTGAKVAQPIIPNPVNYPITQTKNFFLSEKQECENHLTLLHLLCTTAISPRNLAICITVAFYQVRKKKRLVRIKEEGFLS